MNKNDAYKLTSYAEKLAGLEHYIGRAASLFSFPVKYEEQLSEEETNSQVAENLLKCGLIKRWGRGYSFNDEPKFISYFAQHDLPVHENLHGSAVDIIPERAKIKAFGECLERLALVHPDQLPTIKASYLELKALNKDALDPASCLNFSQEYLPTGIEEYRKLLQSMPMRWVAGKNFITDKPAYLPYQLVYLPTIEELETDPVVRIPISTGAACGDNFEDAALRGALECMERDANMLTWLCQREVREVELDTPLTNEILQYVRKYNLDLKVWDVTSDLGVPSYIAIVFDQTGIGPSISAGTKADLDKDNAVVGAILEAFHGRSWIRSSYHFAGKPEIKAKDVLDLPTRGFYWYKRDKIKYLDFLLGSSKTIKLSESKDCSTKDLAGLIKILKQKNIAIYGTDLSLEPMKKKGICVARVIIPAMQPMHLDEDMPYYAGTRLDKYLNGKTINRIPAPFL